MRSPRISIAPNPNTVVAKPVRPSVRRSMRPLFTPANVLVEPGSPGCSFYCTRWSAAAHPPPRLTGCHDGGIPRETINTPGPAGDVRTGADRLAHCTGGLPRPSSLTIPLRSGTWPSHCWPLSRRRDVLKEMDLRVHVTRHVYASHAVGDLLNVPRAPPADRRSGVPRLACPACGRPPEGVPNNEPPDGAMRLGPDLRASLPAVLHPSAASCSWSRGGAQDHAHLVRSMAALAAWLLRVGKRRH